jgi:hypothetical protein
MFRRCLAREMVHLGPSSVRALSYSPRSRRHRGPVLPFRYPHWAVVRLGARTVHCFRHFFRSWDARRSPCGFSSHWRRAPRVRSSTGISWALPAAPEVACPDRKHRPASPLADTLNRNAAPGASSRKHSLTCLDLDFRATEVIALTTEGPAGFLYSRGLSGSMRGLKGLLI